MKKLTKREIISTLRRKGLPAKKIPQATEAIYFALGAIEHLVPVGTDGQDRTFLVAVFETAALAAQIVEREKK